jgi:hypothetical protein
MQEITTGVSGMHIMEFAMLKCIMRGRNSKIRYQGRTLVYDSVLGCLKWYLLYRGYLVFAKIKTVKFIVGDGSLQKKFIFLNF